MRVRSLKCPKCGGRTRLVDGEQEAACLHCGQPVRLSDAVLEEQGRARKYPPQTPLRLGMIARWANGEYELIGRQVMEQKEEESVSRWEEFVLVSRDGKLLFLEYDEGKWKLTESFVPSVPVGPEALGKTGVGGMLGLEGRPVPITDAGTYRVIHAEGEFPWLVNPDRVVHYRDAAGLKQFYCVEWTEDEVEYYKGRFVADRQVMAMFEQHRILAAMEARDRVVRSRRWFGAVCLVAALVAFFYWIAATQSGRPIASGSFDIAGLTALGDKGVRSQPFQLTSKDRVHRMEIHGAMREQSVWVGAVLEDSQERELIAAERDMWDESGYDDGYWHESDLHGSTDFVLRQPGTYYVRVFAEPDPGRTAGGSVTFQIKERALHPTYPLVFAIVAVILGICFLLAGASTSRSSMWASQPDTAAPRRAPA